MSATKKSERPNSPAVQIVQLAGSGPFRSYRRLNDAYHAALKLAVRAGLKFDLDDFRYIDDTFYGQYWMWPGACGREKWHGMAVAARNTSAILSCEAWLKRGPFIFDQIVNTRRDGVCRRRLVVGDMLVWRLARLTVTSFAQDGKSIIACRYDVAGIIKRRTRITLTELKADMRARRKGKQK